MPIKKLWHLEREFELNSLGASDELQMNTVAQQATEPNPAKPKPTCHYCKKPGHFWAQCRHLTREEDQTESNKTSAGNNNNNINSAQPNFYPNNETANNINSNKTNNWNNRKPRIVYPSCETLAKRTTPQRKAILEPTQQLDRLLDIEDQRDRGRI